MGAAVDTYQLTVYRLTGDGNGGFWWTAKDSNDRVYQINYAGENDIVENAGQLFHVDTFLQLLTALDANNIALPQVELNINVEDISDREGLQSQFTSITNAQINAIALAFNPVALCKLFGVFALVRKFYINGHLTLAQLSEVLLYLGVEGKISRQKVENVTQVLLDNGEITQAQYNSFWVQWQNHVGGQ